MPFNAAHDDRPVNVIPLDCRSGFPTAEAARLSAGESVELTGRVLTLRDASAARLAEAIELGEPLPVSLDGQIMYAVGPSPAKPGQIIGSAGPTTTERMGRYLPALFSAGVRAVIGKGELHGRTWRRSPNTARSTLRRSVDSVRCSQSKSPPQA
jgi:tartrate dehydratase beta subunit/fumarate hydratase class I family protein